MILNKIELIGRKFDYYTFTFQHNIIHVTNYLTKNDSFILNFLYY